MTPWDKRYEAVVIGTSAGGFQAMVAILEKMPRDFPLPVIIVQHRAKDSRDLFEEVLQSKCSIRIKQADEKEKITGGRVYTAPADYHLLVETDRTFSLSSDFPVRFSRPSIDVLFESASLAYRDKLVGIILTGANDDGAAGITAIANRGGLTIAQNPDEAEFPFMPQASIDTKKIQFIWSLFTISNFLLKLPAGNEKK